MTGSVTGVSATRTSMGAEMSDALRRGAKRCVGPWQREGEKGIAPLFNEENKTGIVR